MASCATEVPGEIGADELKLSDDLRAKVSALAKEIDRMPHLVSTSILHTRAVGDLGAVYDWDQRGQSTTTPDGLKDDVLSAVPRSSRLAPEISRTLSLCGLVPLMSESSSSPRGSEITFIPTARFSLPVVTGGALPTGGRYRASALEIDHRSPCNPRAGDSISITIKGQLLRRVIGPIGTLQRLQDVEEKIRCLIEPGDSKGLPPLTRGDVLHATCKHESTLGSPIESRHAYLPAFRQYVPLLIVRGKGTDTRYEYTVLR